MIAAFVTSAAVVALAEIGDKTMLLAILLAARFRQPWAILGGILCACLANHLAAAFIGSTVAGLLGTTWFRAAVAAGFLAMAGWTLVPDRLDEAPRIGGGAGAFATTLVAFFVVEIGDKTQIATIALAAHYHAVATVAAGTTLGMMLADGPAVFFGDALVRRISLRWARIGAAALFCALGLWQIAALAR